MPLHNADFTVSQTEPCWRPVPRVMHFKWGAWTPVPSLSPCLITFPLIDKQWAADVMRGGWLVELDTQCSWLVVHYSAGRDAPSSVIGLVTCSESLSIYMSTLCSLCVANGTSGVPLYVFSLSLSLSLCCMSRAVCTMQAHICFFMDLYLYTFLAASCFIHFSEHNLSPFALWVCLFEFRPEFELESP